ncbi:MAG: hypothetical protein VX498_12350 [Myxococcota bacterium]|nr:hypothetical protein [Myxococcota bacterium]
MDLLWGIFLFLGSSLAPGIALAWLLLGDRDRITLLTVGTVLGVFALPLFHFSLAMVLGTNIRPPVMLGLGLAVILVAGGRFLLLRNTAEE